MRSLRTTVPTAVDQTTCGWRPRLRPEARRRWLVMVVVATLNVALGLALPVGPAHAAAAAGWSFGQNGVAVDQPGEDHDFSVWVGPTADGYALTNDEQYRAVLATSPTGLTPAPDTSSQCSYPAGEYGFGCSLQADGPGSFHVNIFDEDGGTVLMTTPVTVATVGYAIAGEPDLSPLTAGGSGVTTTQALVANWSVLPEATRAGLALVVTRGGQVTTSVTAQFTADGKAVARASDTATPGGDYLLTVRNQQGQTLTRTSAFTVLGSARVTSPPKAIDRYGRSDDAIELTRTTGVVWVVEPGSRAVTVTPSSFGTSTTVRVPYTAGSTAVVQAQAEAGYQLTGDSAWLLPFSSAGVPLPPAAPTTPTPATPAPGVPLPTGPDRPEPGSGPTEPVLRWSPAPHGGVVTGFQVRSREVTVNRRGRRGYSRWTVRTVATSVTALRVRGRPGQVIQWQVRALGRSGAAGVWTEPRALVFPVDADASRGAFSPGWTVLRRVRGAIGRTIARGLGRRASFTAKPVFTDWVAVYAAGGPRGGSGVLVVDGVVRARFSTRSAVARPSRLAAAVRLPYAAHRITVLTQRGQLDLDGVAFGR